MAMVLVCSLVGGGSGVDQEVTHVTVGLGLTVRYNHGGVGVAASLSKCCIHVFEITFPVLRLASQLEEGSHRLDRMPV